MNVLIIGSGGREHAIAWGVKNSSKVSKVYCAPGNAGTASIAHNVPLKAEDIYGLAQFAQTNDIGLTIVGSEAPLVKGIVDLFHERGLAIFGPSKDAARLEGSKMFLKHFLKRHAIPTASYETFAHTDIDAAHLHIKTHEPPYVIKTDGLAAGKGVAICASREEALKTLKEYFEQKVFGDAGTNIVIEEFMEGEEASVFAMCDGDSYVLLSPAQDHKRIGNGDTGKNTGGMGAYAPAPVVTPDVLKKVEERIIRPTLKGMKEEGYPYTGCLYVGLMIKEVEPKVVEFNVRLGDPETQAVVPLIESDVFDLFLACANGTISTYTMKLKPRSAVNVVLASDGYPDAYQTGKKITGLEKVQEGTLVFHAGTREENGALLSSGGRVLGITALGSDLKEAISSVYQEIDRISFENMYFRNDIGKKGLLQ